MNKVKIILLSFILALPFYLEGQEFDRNIGNNLFVPKGQWLWGGSVSYGQSSADAYDVLVLSGINGSRYNFKVAPYIGYFIKDNLCVGGRFSYRRSMMQLDNVALDLGDDLDLDLSIKDYYSLSHIYSGYAILRNYVALGNSRRFGIFNEVQLGAGGGQGKVVSGRGESLHGTYQKVFELELGLVPGICAFITNNVAVEASVNVLGFKYKRYNQIKNRVDYGSFENSAVNFKIDLLSINIGVSFYLVSLNPLKKRDKN